MTDYAEEQAMELEALEAIYMDDFRLLDPGPPAEFEVILKPNQEGDGENHVIARCVFKHTAGYPDMLPELAVESAKGLSEDQCAHLRRRLLEEGEANLGMALVYTVCEGAREWLAENNVERGDGSMYDEMMRRQREAVLKDELEVKRAAAAREARAAEAARDMTEDERKEEERKQYGTLVTAELFEQWRRGFEAEMEEFQDMRAKRLGHIGKPTGRDMFELAKADKITVAQAAAKLGSIAEAGLEEEAERDYGDEGDDDAGAAPMDEDLFLEEDDVDLDELDDEGEEEEEEEVDE